MNILVTAGNTAVPIDRVRCLTNIFTGRTGARIALSAHDRGHAVTLLTSHPDAVKNPERDDAERWSVRPYRTFDDLHRQMADSIRTARLDAIVHSAAVSDYAAAGIYAPESSTRFAASNLRWESEWGKAPELIDVSAGKVKSDRPELWLRLVRTPKLVDLVRSEWKFTGVLVKFKLEVGVSEEGLLEIAERSRIHSGADLMIANTLEGAAEWAYIGPIAERYERVSRETMPGRLLDVLNRLDAATKHSSPGE